MAAPELTPVDGVQPLERLNEVFSYLYDLIVALQLGGLRYKEAVAAAATANVALTGTYTVDGETLSDDDRYLAPAQTDPAENGIYIYNSSGAHARATDMDAAGDFQGSTVYVSEGTANGGTTWRTESVVETLGTDDIVWTNIANTSANSAALALKANLASPALTGTPTAPTASAGTDTTQIATTAFAEARATLVEMIAADIGRDVAQQEAQAGQLLSAEYVLEVSDPNSGIVLAQVDYDGRWSILRGGEDILLDAEYSHVTASETGEVAIGHRHDGGLTVGPYTYGALLDAEYMSVTGDYAGSVAQALDHAGVDPIQRSLKAWCDSSGAWLRGPDGTSRLVVADAECCYIGGGMLHIISTDGDDYSTPLAHDVSILADTVTEVRLIAGYGQSGITGYNSGALYTTTVPVTGRTVMWERGPRPAGHDQNSISGRMMPDEALHAWADYVEVEFGVGAETCFGSLLTDYVADEGSTVALLGATLGVGAQTMQAISPGGAVWSNMLVRGVVRARLMAAMAGKDFVWNEVFFDQGEGNVATDTTEGAYLARMGTLSTALDALATELGTLDGEDEVAWFYAQMPNFPYYGYPDYPWVPIDQLQAHINDPDTFWCVGPRYQYEYTDNAHMTAAGQYSLGARKAIVARIRRDGGSWTPVRPISAVRSGAVVDVTFEVPVPPLVLDTSVVSDPGDYGVTWRDAGDGNSVSISSVAVQSPTVLRVTLDGTPTGTAQEIGIAIEATSGAAPGPTTGARACIRDSDTAEDGRSVVLHNYACHEIIDVTT
jgi:hypothetical protein